MVKISQIEEAMERLAPRGLAEAWDNVGLLVGEHEAYVEHVLLSLDIVDEVVEEAIELGAGLIITHHPPIFKPMDCITSQTALGRRIIRLIRNEVAVFTSHTNLDIAEGGTNSRLAEVLGLINVENLLDNGMGRVGMLNTPTTLLELAETIKESLGANYVSYAGVPETIIRRVGLCTGAAAGGEFFHAAAKKACDVYITGDVRYHSAQAAQDLGLTIIDATHYYSEVIVLNPLKTYLQEKFPSLKITISNHNSQEINII